MRRLALVVAVALASLSVACGEDEPLGQALTGSGGSSGAAGSGGDAGAPMFSASYSVQPSVEQLFVTHATEGLKLGVYDDADQLVAEGTADKWGSLVFRNVTPGSGYLVKTIEASPAEKSGPYTVMSIDGSKPSQDFYDSQTLVAGSNYITMRDGTQLAAYITLPGPPEKGPYPTVVNYSGYDPARPGEPIGDYAALCGSLPVLCDAPADPSALIAALMGYATVGVNMRGTGCSGGAYDFFEPLQLLDGYDVIETVAAQDWVKGHKVGMTGLSYPGITQLFVAKTHPPSLAAITPLSVIGSTHTTLLPGGILNNGFALSWAQNVLDKAGPYKQGWEQDRVDAGDTVCEENQLLHDQRVDIIQKAHDNPFYTDDVVGPLNPTLFVDQIDIPVFLAGAWQDEQTGPYFVTLLDRFESAPVVKLTVYNGVHPDGFAPQVLGEWKNFLDLYVADEVPSISPAVRTLAPLLFKEIFKVELDLPKDRFTSFTKVEDARAAFEKEPSLRAIFEDGAKDPLGAPLGNFEETYASWPPPVDATRYFFEPDGSLGSAAPTDATAAVSFDLDPAAGERGILAPGANVWDPLPDYAWAEPEAGKAVVFETAPLAADVVMLGTGSVDLSIKSTVEDADLEVNLSEVRPDGKEMYVQSGWLRASHRAVASSSTELWPEHPFTEEAAAPLVPGEWTEARVAIPGFSHAFRAGSRIRISVDTPGDSRAEWRFELKKFSAGATHTIGASSTHPSSVVLPVLSSVTVPTPLPPCPSLRGQQCRDYVPFTNLAAQ